MTEIDVPDAKPLKDPKRSKSDGRFGKKNNAGSGGKVAATLSRARLKWAAAIQNEFSAKDAIESMRVLQEIFRDPEARDSDRILAADKFQARLMGKVATEVLVEHKHTSNRAELLSQVLASFGVNANQPALPEPTVAPTTQEQAIDVEFSAGTPPQGGPQRGFDEPVPAIPEEVDRRPEEPEDRGEGASVRVHLD